MKIHPAVLELGKFIAGGPLLFFLPSVYIYSYWLNETGHINQSPML